MAGLSLWKPVMADRPTNGGTPGRRCPNCGKPSDEKSFPFCSSRCKTLDLGRWFNEDYAIPAIEIDDEFDEIEDEDPEEG